MSGAANDFNNVVIRWLNTDYSSIRGHSCNSYIGCIDSPPTPSNHIFLSSYWDSPNTSPPTRRWNNPRWTPGMGTNEDMISVLMHEMGHLFENTGDSSATGTTVIRAPADFTSRYLWNTDIFGIDNGRYDGHTQVLQYFAVNPTNGGATWISQVQPPFAIRSPASLATGNNAGYTGHYLVAYGTTTPAGSTGNPNALLVRLTDAASNNVDRVVQGSLNGVAVGTTFHRPCVAASATGSDHYLVWTSPVEVNGSGWRQVLSAESHNGGAFTWSQPEAIPGAFTRSGVSCAIDRATERLVVVFTGAGEEGLFLAHRPSLTPGAGQWGSNVIRLLPSASTYGPPDVAFDFFNGSTPGTVTWQDNADLNVHSAPLFFSGGTYVTGTPFIHTAVDPARLRSWPVATVESNPILGTSMFSASTTPANSSEERRNFPGGSPVFMSSEAYSVGGGSNPARRYTGAASNRVLNERAFLSTANLGQ